MVDLVGDEQEVVVAAEGGERARARRGSRPGRRGCAASRGRRCARGRSAPRRAHRGPSRSGRPRGARAATATISRLVGADDAVEGVVDRGEEDDAVAGLGEGLQARWRGRRRCRGWWRSRRGRPPSRGGGPSSRGSPPCRRGRRRSSRRRRARPRRERGGDLGRRAEVHVGDPHGEPVVGRDAVERLHHVPLRAVGAAAVDDLVEVEHGSPAPGCTVAGAGPDDDARASAPATGSSSRSLPPSAQRVSGRARSEQHDAEGGAGHEDAHEGVGQAGRASRCPCRRRGGRPSGCRARRRRTRSPSSGW